MKYELYVEYSTPPVHMYRDVSFLRKLCSWLHVRMICTYICTPVTCYGERRNPHSRHLVTSIYFIPQLLTTEQKTSHPYPIFSSKNSNNSQIRLLITTFNHHLISTVSFIIPLPPSYLTHQVQTCSFFFPSSPALDAPLPPPNSAHQSTFLNKLHPRQNLSDS